MQATRTSLLERVRSEDGRAWEEFYSVYWEPILRYSRKLGLRDADAGDVLQETMVALMSILPRFEYDRRKGKFRNFLLTIVHRKCLAAHRRAKRRGEVPLEAPASEDGLAPLDKLEAVPEDLPDENAWREALMVEAVKRLTRDPRMKPETLAAFRAYVIEGRPAPEVAREFGIKENALYQVRNRLIKKLQDEVELLEREARLESIET